MKKFIQKCIAKIFNSSYVRGNPFIFGINDRVKEVLDQEKTTRQNYLLEQVVMGKNSSFYEESMVHNASGNPKNIIIGEDTHIRGELLVQKYGGKITIGYNSYVGTSSRIWSGESISIGNNVLVSHNCNIIDTNSHEIEHIERSTRHAELIKNGPWTTKGSILTKPIVIEDYAWISFDVTILKGVTIGKGAIVAAGSLITKDVAPFTVVAGNPAKVINQLSE